MRAGRVSLGGSENDITTVRDAQVTMVMRKNLFKSLAGRCDGRQERQHTGTQYVPGLYTLLPPASAGAILV